MKNLTMPSLPICGLAVLMTVATCISSPVGHMSTGATTSPPVTAPTPVVAPMPGVPYGIVNRNSGKALETFIQSTAYRGSVNQQSFNFRKNQLWSFCPIATSSRTNAYYIYNMNSGLVLDVNGSVKQPGMMIGQSIRKGSISQQWQITNAGGSYVTITNVNSKLVLDVFLAAKRNKAAIIQWVQNKQANQQWQLLPASGAKGLQPFTCP